MMRRRSPFDLVWAHNFASKVMSKGITGSRKIN